MKELSYVLINPYTMYKSRTGGVINRLLSRSSELQLVGARMFAPGAELIEDFISVMTPGPGPVSPAAEEVFTHIKEYVRAEYMPQPDGQRRRVMFLLVEGEEAVRILRDEVVGSVIRETTGETIRDTYGDFIKDTEGNVVYFEPAVLTASTPESALNAIDIWLKYAEKDSGILYDVTQYDNTDDVENTLVMIKPDTMGGSRTRAGAVIDLFSKTGLYIIGTKLIRMSVAQAMEFYGPVRDVFVSKFVNKVAGRVKSALSQEFDFVIDDDIVESVAQKLTPYNADYEFGRIVKFITGRSPSETPSELLEEPGTEQCLALVYQGHNAIEKIRTQLGSTDPEKAAPATVRKEFGRDVMVNTAHASDSIKSATREIGILDIASNDLTKTVEAYRAYIKENK